jgi:glycosyl transferase family 25
MKIFVVNLSRVKARTEYITAHLDSLALDYELIDAVDYVSLTPEDFAVLSDQEAVSKNPFLTPGVIASSLSQVKIFKKMVAEDVKIGLVLEDDAVLPKNIKTILALIEGEIRENEIISLSYFNHHKAKKSTDLSKHQRKKIGNNLELVYPVDIHDIASAMAYVITKGAAEKMIEVSMPISDSTDHWGVHYDKGGFTSFRCVYPPQVKAAVLRSSIDYVYGKTLLSKFAGWVRKNKIPVLMTYLNRRTDILQGQKYHFSFIDAPPFNANR